MAKKRLKMKKKEIKNNKEILTIVIGVIGTILIAFLIILAIYKITSLNENKNTNNTQLEKQENNKNTIKNEKDNNTDLSTGTGTNTPNKITVYVFKRDTCPHCHNALNFFQSILLDYDFLDVIALEVSNPANAAVLRKVADKFNVSAITSVPLIMIGKNYILNSYNNTRDEELKTEINKAYKDANYEDLIETILTEFPDLEISPEILEKEKS